jgi:EAL and modified HD-GYP domain-containing signal transduction protein
MIALDDFVADDPREALAEWADIIKVDMLLTTEAQRAIIIKRYGPRRCRMLAEKVETREDFLRARDCGFVYFQGYFFRRPEMLHIRDMPANRLNYLRMLQKVAQPELDVGELETLIKAEASVCYRLLRYLNSAMFGLKNEVHSVRHALAMLGERDVRRWVRLVAAVGAGQDKTSDLLLSALVRGRFGELLAPRVAHGESDLFLLGLLSLLDALLEVPMAEVLEKVPLDQETKAVLLGQPSALRPVYQLMLAHESGEWKIAAELSEKLKLDSEEVAGEYWRAQTWAREVSAGG